MSLSQVDDYDRLIERAWTAFQEWSLVPAPKRGEVIRSIGDRLREHVESLGLLVSLEVGKSPVEGKGEVQEMIDIGDFAVGLSRQLYGKTIASERRHHRLYEQWHPHGVVGEETFAPILYVLKYKNLEDAFAIHNCVSQGLSSAIFSNNLREVEAFLGVAGSDCGLASVNTGTAGAEIGGGPSVAKRILVEAGKVGRTPGKRTPGARR